MLVAYRRHRPRVSSCLGLMRAPAILAPSPHTYGTLTRLWCTPRLLLPPAQVVVAEGAPRFDGHLMARKLADAGITTTLIADSAVYAMMARANKVGFARIDTEKCSEVDSRHGGVGGCKFQPKPNRTQCNRARRRGARMFGEAVQDALKTADDEVVKK